jgi:FKBP-type peptidyl-prolyl cis-trans isomerase FklB
MKKVMIGMAILLASGQVIAQKNKQVQTVEVPAAKTEVNTGKVSKERIDSVSYLIGLSIGQNVMKEMSEANWKLVVKGIQDVFENKAPAIVDPSNQCVSSYFQEKSVLKQAETEKESAGLKAVGEKFLIENAKKSEVVTTASGLQYQILKAADGPKPNAESKVKVHYHGTTIDGTVFDSSVDRGEPIEFGLNQVIPGWTEGVQLMSVGSKYKFFIPQAMAYGAQSPSPAIAPYSTLIFEVELLGFE